MLTAGCSSSNGSGNASAAGGDGNVADGSGSTLVGTCGIKTDVSGATTIHFTGQNDAACLTQHSFDSGLDGIFSGTEAKGSLELIVDTVTEGQTGVDFPSRIVVTSTARDNWQGSGCVTTVTEHHLLKTEQSSLGELRHYQVSGNGSCTETLDSVPAGGEPVTVGPFELRAEFTWRD